MSTVGLSRRWRLLAAVLAATALATPGAASGVCLPSPDPADCVDHFTCYDVWITKGTPAFVAISGVSLVDQFAAASVTVRKQSHLCLPTNKNEEGVLDSDTHLMSYIIREQNPRTDPPGS